MSEDVWKCALDGKEYNFASGYSKINGTKVPGGSVDQQTKVMLPDTSQSIFDTRNSRLGYNS